jgi:hypothetical protein
LPRHAARISRAPGCKEVKWMNTITMVWLGIMAVIGIVMIVMKKKMSAKDED